MTYFYICYIIIRSDLNTAGICSGVFMSQRATILSDLIGEERVPTAFGIQLVCTGLATLVARIVGGKITHLQTYYVQESISYAVLISICAFWGFKTTVK